MVQRDLNSRSDVADRDTPSDHVRVVEYDSAWPLEYAKEAPVVAVALGPCVLEIHHIGSTAIAGMPAKPLIDIMVAVRTLGPIDDYRPIMKALGYRVQPTGDPARHCFKKGLPRTHHVHIVQRGGSDYCRMLRFRDYIASHPERASQYAELKHALARKYGTNRDLYTSSKSTFIDETLKLCDGDGRE